MLEGQTAEGAVWQKLVAVLNTYYPTESGVALPIVKFAIDSGYANANSAGGLSFFVGECLSRRCDLLP